MAYRKVSGHIRERNNKQGEVTSYQVVLYLGKKPNGKNHELYFSAKTYEEAERILAEKQANYILQELQEPNNMTVSYYLTQEWFPNYVENTLKPTSVRAYECHMKYVNEMIGAVKLQKLTTTQIQQMYITLMHKSPLSDKPLSYRTVLDVHRTLTSALNVAKEVGYIKSNPTVGTKLRKPSTFEEEKKMVYDAAEVQKLLKGVKGTPLEVFFRLIIEATLRRGEALALLWSDIDWEKGTVRVNKNWVEDRNNKPILTTPKTKSSIRTIKLTDEMMELLRKAKLDYNTRKLASGNEFIDSQRIISQINGKSYNPKSFYQLYKRTIRKLQLPELRLHDLRHTGITLQLENGANIKAVSSRAGHSSIKITGDIYGHCTQKMEDETVGILKNVFDDKAVNQ